MFYDKLKYLCELNNTSPTTVTTLLGMSKGSISNWKNGVVPNGDAIVRFAEHFNVPTDFLLLDTPITCINLTNEEKEILTLYNSLDEKSKTIIKGKLYEYEKENKIK